MSQDDVDEFSEPIGAVPIIPEVSEATWHALFQAAEAVHRIQPWKVLVDGDLFAMHHPDSNDVSLGSVLGHGQKVSGVQLYRMPEGIRFWNDTFKTGKPNYSQLQLHNHMLDAEFQAKGRLDPEDHRVRDQLGLPKLPNKGRPYPIFRSMRPEAMPWFLEEDEARLLTLALRLSLLQAKYFTEQGGGEKVDYPKDESGIMKIPTYRLKAGGDAMAIEDWERSEEAMPQAPPEEEAATSIPEEGLIARFEGLPTSEATWQIASLNMPMPGLSEGRMRYPRVVLSVDSQSGGIVGYLMDKPTQDAGEHYRRAFAEATEKAKALPKALHVNGPVGKNVFSELAETLNIELKIRLTMDKWVAGANLLVEKVTESISKA